jgi:hypothetical protein
LGFLVTKEMAENGDEAAIEELKRIRTTPELPLALQQAIAPREDSGSSNEKYRAGLDAQINQLVIQSMGQKRAILGKWLGRFSSHP